MNTLIFDRNPWDNVGQRLKMILSERVDPYLPDKGIMFRLMDGCVIFNYRDQNNLLRKTEATRKFSCPFCLLRCGSFKGLRCHLITSHDLFKCEFWVSNINLNFPTETHEYRAVNVSVRTDALHSETTADEIDPQLQSFSFWLLTVTSLRLTAGNSSSLHSSRPRKRRREEDPQDKGKHVYPHVLEPAVFVERLHRGPLESNEGEKDPSSGPNNGDLHNSRSTGEGRCYENGKGNGADYVAASGNPGAPVARAQSLDDIESISVDKSVPSTLLPSTKSRKLSFERSDSKRYSSWVHDSEGCPGMPKDCGVRHISTLLQKRQFYHSHRAQPMALDQVLSDKDSEDEVDDDIADLEDRRMLDDFVDVTKDEKHLMHLWNSFVRKQRVLADGHVPWACEAFLQLNGKKLVQSRPLFWCWRLFMVKLWNHGLLDACTMNNCSMILQKFQDEDSSADGNCSNTCKPEA
ncbi:hypothetical protein Cgig2_019905 [Carnegiea gigantea]|uniref:Polycomb protein VEFS-Box domain-containing protein n=1 Tax=Carnegiea gigantea TaxID=171969 RepID=A0A9Q1KKH6_9CARY|nr:hypothetical protein Cgig2_019905 [Carnegiea gigantea]